MAGAVVFQLFFNQSEALASEKEIRELVHAQYEGSTITSIEERDKIFEVVIDHNMGEYQLMVDGLTREITSLKLLARNEETEDIDNQETEQPDAEEPKHEESAPSMLTKEQAIEIALKEVPGKVDDIELDEKNGIKVYEVEIEVDDDTEATIIINAYTGKIISLTWD
jgi:uncharacterized membrane protein YkoI